MKKLFYSLSMLVIASLLVSGLFMAFPSNVLAKGLQGPIDDALTQAFKAEGKWLTDQQQAINKADQAATQVQQLIDKGAKAGLDVTILQNALATFNNSMVNVKSGYQSATDTLANHNGFDNDGNVTDRQAARVTVLDAKQSLWKTHVSMTQAARDLSQAARDWKKATFPQG
jgi:hypothetical protein